MRRLELTGVSKPAKIELDFLLDEAASFDDALSVFTAEEFCMNELFFLISI